MVISHKNKFVFIQVPRTASSFLGRNFVKHYNGYKIISKHATFAKFLKVASPEEAKYCVIVGKRNPMDRIATLYVRTLINKNIPHPAEIAETQRDFERWFRTRFIEKKKSLNPHLKQSYPFADHIISYENMIRDLTAVLKSMGLEPFKIRPWKGRTKGKLEDYSQYYSKSLMRYAREVFREEMAFLGYELPDD